MQEPDPPRQRIQFPLRALFIITLLAAVVVVVTRWVIGLEHAGPLAASVAIGFAVGFATVVILQHVPNTSLLAALLGVFVLMNGLWFAAYVIPYGGGVIAGAIIGWKGLRMLNALLAWCGFTVSKTKD